MNPTLEAAVRKARGGQALTDFEEETLVQGVASATNSDPGKHRETVDLIKRQRLTIIEDVGRNLAITELVVVPVTRSGLNYPATGYCLVEPGGDPVLRAYGRTEAEAWSAGEREFKLTRAELKQRGCRVVLADFPDAS